MLLTSPTSGKLFVAVFVSTLKEWDERFSYKRYVIILVTKLYISPSSIKITKCEEMFSFIETCQLP